MRMTEVGGMRLERRGRKRKLPFNWDDVYQSSSEDEKNIIKKKVLPHVHLLFSAQSKTIFLQLLEANFNLNATFQSSSEDEEDPKKVK